MPSLVAPHSNLDVDEHDKTIEVGDDISRGFFDLWEVSRILYAVDDAIQHIRDMEYFSTQVPHHAPPTEVTLALPEGTEKKSENVNKTNGTLDKYIYRVHSSGHKVLISRYSQMSSDVFSAQITQENLQRVLCILKQPIVIDTDSLSRIQLSGTLQTIFDMDKKIAVSDISRNGKNVLIAKYIG